MNPAKISACMIVKNEGDRLEKAILSVKEFVDELVIVDTGSSDNTLDIVKKYADKYEVFTACNDADGNIMSFAMARQRSLELASHDWMIWLDGDDEIINGHVIREIVNKYNGSSKVVSIVLPYEYAQNDLGQVTCLLYRERIVYPAKEFRWSGAVHEVLLQPENRECVNYINDVVKYVHRRKGKVINPNRNINILKNEVSKGNKDPRTLYYLGLESASNGYISDSIKYFEEYIKVSGWDEEKCLACIKLSDHFLILNDLDSAINWATKSMCEREGWFEPYFQLAKCYYFLACKKEASGEPARSVWEKCVNFAAIGLNLPPTKTVLFINPQDREFEVHKYLNFALNKLGRVKEALNSVETALSANPNDNDLLLNKKVYENHLAKVALNSCIDTLCKNGEFGDNIKDVINSVISGDGVAVEVDPKNKTEIMREIIRLNSQSEVTAATDRDVIWPTYFRSSNYPQDVSAAHFPQAIITPHSQAWGIPEEFVYDDLPLRMTDKQLQALVVALWKEYMLHDEVLSAISLLENAPYRVRHSNEIEAILAKTKATIDWNKNPELLQKYNTPIHIETNEPIEHEMVPLPLPLGHQANMRMKWLADRMVPGASIVDFGCIDGEMTNRWGLAGFKPTGVDICEHSVKIANTKAEEFKTGATHIQSTFVGAVDKLHDKFDYATAADIYEHLFDPVNELLKPAFELTKEDGALLLVTPHGSWMRGEFVPYAYPWVRGPQENHHWLEDHRSHVIAPTVWSTVAHIREAGWWVHTANVINQWAPEVPGQGNVCIKAFKKPPAGWPGLDIVFYIGKGVEEWNPISVDFTGMGGSETAAIYMAKNLAARGNRVRVYSDCHKFGEGIYEGVEYMVYDKYHDLNCDVLISSRVGMALHESLNIETKLRLLWVHDVFPLQYNHSLALRTDKILALSNWHKDNIVMSCQYIHPDQIHVTRNGINIDRFKQDAKVRDPHRVVYSSSPDRGLESLLQMWPRIKAQVPDAKLDVYYGFKNWEYVGNQDAGQAALIQKIKNLIESLKNYDVNYYDRQPQQVLAEKFKESGAWLYPTWFWETSCITAMEAQAAGLKIVTSSRAALDETVGPRGVRLDGDWLSPEYQSKFIEEAVKALTNTTNEERAVLKSYALENFNWEPVADEWLELIQQWLSEKEAGTFKIPYISP